MSRTIVLLTVVVTLTTDATLIATIKAGTVTLADLAAAGALQRGVAGDDYDLAGCPDTVPGSGRRPQLRQAPGDEPGMAGRRVLRARLQVSGVQ